MPNKLYTAVIIETNSDGIVSSNTAVAHTPDELHNKIKEMLYDYSFSNGVELTFNDRTLSEICSHGNTYYLALEVNVPDDQDKEHRLLIGVDIHSLPPEKTVQHFEELKDYVPWGLFGDANPKTAERQTLLADLKDWVRDQRGAGPSHGLLPYALLGLRAASLGWDGLPGKNRLREMVSEVNGILERNRKNCRLESLKRNPRNGTWRAALTHYDDEGNPKQMNVLEDYTLLNYLDNIFEEEKGILPF